MTLPAPARWTSSNCAHAASEEVVGRLWFRRDWLDRRGLDPARCVVIGVTGESMEPTLPDGSSILVDRARTRRRQGRVYVLRTGDGLIAKRAGKSDGGGWLLESDHPAWASVPWPADAELLGEVTWTARSLIGGVRQQQFGAGRA
ncbi:MAG: helix-turn-helix transcriptional regulator [Alphaproteobacteria bacterium]|nr:helix-turn-helix transcriptional regulator [Alphaproteobacteria bacterium]